MRKWGLIGRNKTVLDRRNLLKGMLLLAPLAILASCSEQRRATDQEARRKAWRKRRPRR